MKPLTVWCVMPPVRSIVQRFSAANCASRLSASVAPGSDGSAPRWMPAWASTSLRPSSRTCQPR